MSYDTTKVNKTGTTYDPADTTHIWADDWNAFVAAYKTHAARHKKSAADPIKLDELADPDNNTNLNVSIAAHGLCPLLPNNTTTFLRGDGTWAVPSGAATGDVVGPAGATEDDIVLFDTTTGKLIKDSTKKISDLAAATHTHTESDVTDLTTDLAGKADLAHGSRHEAGGADEISVAGLAGLLSDAQTPLAHNQAATTITSGELDGDRLPAMSATKRGSVPATGTPASKFLRDDGTWVTGGTIGGNTGATDNAVQRADGAGGSTVQNSLMTIDDSGSVNIPTGQTYKINNVTITPGSLTADTTEATTWDTNTTLTNTLNRIRHQIVTITGEAWDTVSHSLTDIWAKFHATTGHKHTAAAGDAPQLDHGLLGGLTDDDHVRYFDKDGSKALTGITINRNVDDSYLYFYGGSAYPCAALCLSGKDSVYDGLNGGFCLRVVNAAKTGWIDMLRVVGEVAPPVLTVNSHKITNVVDPTADQDAATKNYVDTRVPLIKYGATATVADGGTITHKLGGTPTTVICTSSVSAEFISVTAKGATTFTVAIKKHDGSAGTTQTVYWVVC